jgi:hypothetical protein
MKEYPKTYEDIYGLKQKINTFQFNINKVSSDTFDSQSEYIELFKNTFLTYEQQTFDSIVKLVWFVIVVRIETN